MTRPAVSVIVSNFNGAKYLPRLLETLHAQQDVTFEIIVVDRNSTDASAEILAADPNVRVVSEPPQSGLVTGYAVGAEAATHPLLFFCNEDMWFKPDCLSLLVRHFDAPDVGAADPAQWTYDGKVLIRAATRFEPAQLEVNGPDPWRKPNFVVPAPSGAITPFACAGALMIRRDVYEAVGGWDRSFFLDLEDLDLGIRLWQAGWRTVIEPAAEVFHAVNVSNTKTLPGQVSVSRRRYESARSSVLIIAAKYFPASRFAAVTALFLASVAYHALTGRWKMARFDTGALGEFRRRLPAALAYRRTHRDVNRARPVTNFYRAPEFQRNVRRDAPKKNGHAIIRPESLRFLFASDFFPDPDAGSAGSILDVGTALVRRGHEVDYLWRENQAQVWMPHPFFSRWHELPRRQFRQISEHLSRASYDVVVIYQPYAAAVFERLPALYPDTLFLNGTHGWEDRFHDARLHFAWDGPYSYFRRLGLRTTKALINRLCRRTAIASHGLMAPTEKCAAYIRTNYHVPPEKVGVVRTGLDDAFFQSAPERAPSDTVRMLYVGNYLRLRSRMLETILPSIGTRFPNARMTFIVNSAAVREVRAKFEPFFGDRLTVRSWVRRSEMPAIYSAHDLLVFPSLFEGFGRVMLEGMANGLCVVGFSEGGLPDIATSGEDALYCETGDAPALQALLERCLRNPEIVHAIGKRARITARKYPLSTSGELVEAFVMDRRRAVFGTAHAPRS